MRVATGVPSKRSVGKRGTGAQGQLNFCIVVVEPLEHGMNRVFVKTKDERIRNTFLAHQDTYVVSDTNVALLARQIALHCAVSTAGAGAGLRIAGGR